MAKYFRRNYWRGLKGLGLSRSWRNRLSVLVVLAALISGIATYAALTETPPLGNDPDTIIWLLYFDVVLLLMLVALIARRIVALWSGRKRKLAGSHLHVRLVRTFSILAAAPAIIMTVFSALFFHYGVQTWFSERVSTAINESQAVAQAYLEEHKQVIKADILAMAHDLDRQAPFLMANNDAFEKLVQTQSLLRNFSEAVVFDTSRRVLARSGLTFALEFEDLPVQALQQAEEGRVIIMTGRNDDRVRALVKLGNFIDSFLFVGRMVDPKVLSHVTATRQASEDYENLQARYSNLQVTFILMFVIVGLILMLVAIWLGLLLARQLVKPISVLIKTADRVRAGDLAARVPEQETLEEFDYLAQSFNRMTKQIQEQQNELLSANRQLDRRRRLTETVLEGVSSGVIGLDADGQINLANNTAIELLGHPDQDLTGKDLKNILPEITELLDKAHLRPQKITQGEIPVQHKDGPRRVFLVRIVIELVGDTEVGAIITFDDITELQSAQRKAAWADVARRIAHEIKNPLTPIQLSAERLRRKYLEQIQDEPETFAQCTETIIKNVNDIGRMVNEFSSFARMPDPNLKYEDLREHIEESLVLHQQAHNDIEFELVVSAKGDEQFMAELDSRQVRQALNNLIQNAVDSIQSRIEEDKKSDRKARKGQIRILLAHNEERDIVLIISDNGLGLPKTQNPVHLTEPYVTHKPKGTGLGLAIVKKIMEDHDGSLILDEEDWLKTITGWKPVSGACITLIFPFSDKDIISEAAE